MKKITQIILSILVSILIAFEVYPASDTNVLVFNTYAIPPLSTKKATGYYDVLIFEAARRANINISIKWMPERRGIIMANQGEQDGHYPRTAEALQSFPNLTIVPTPIYRSKFIAVTKNPIANFSGWESLNKYKVAYPMGWKIFENRKDYYGSAYPIPYPEKLMELVQADRVDIALYEKTAFDLLANRIDLKNLTIINPPLLTFDLYLALNKKHDALIPELSRSLKEIIDDGSMAKLCPPCASSLTE